MNSWWRMLPMALIAVGSSGAAFAFSEDICWVGDGSLVACTPLPQDCEPVGTASVSCMSAALSVYSQASSNEHLRSIVHTDSTALMAQAVGFSADDAYWIAAYDQAVDLGEYEPVDWNAQSYGGGTLRTARIDGLQRTNLNSGGVFYHFVSPRGAASSVDGLHPNVNDAQAEGFLAHLRSWAMAASGSTRPLCGDGLTAYTGFDYALGTTCFARAGGGAADINGQIAAIAATSVSFTVQTGSQLIQTATQSTPAVYAESFDSAVGGDPNRIANARLGIYLHALGDRISHHVCTDQTALIGPTTTPARSFSVDMTNADCGQGWHALRHIWEIGIDQSQLDERDRTLEATLLKVYDELAAFAASRGVLIAGAADASVRDAWVARLLPVLALESAGERLEKIGRLACENGFSPFPGTGACLLGNGFE